MPDIETTYRSYLLRLWHENEPAAPWRVMLESINDPGQRHYFKDLKGLTAYLLTQQEPAPEATKAEGEA